MRVAAVTRKRLISSAQGAVLAALCGLVLWIAPLGDSWVNASYDYLFRFGARSVTNNVAVILMDNESYDYYNQTRGQPWDRSLHTQLLNKLADDGCSLVVMDCFFREPRDQTQDRALAAAMRRQHHIALMAEQAQVTYSTMLGMRPLRPAEPFYSAAATGWESPGLTRIQIWSCAGIGRFLRPGRIPAWLRLPLGRKERNWVKHLMNSGCAIMGGTVRGPS